MSNTSIQRCIEILEFIENNSWQQALTQYGIKKEALKDYLRKIAREKPNLKPKIDAIRAEMLPPNQTKMQSDKEPIESFETDFNEKAGTGKIDSTSTKITTVEDAIDFSEVDTDVWEYYRSKVNHWDVTMKLKKSDGTEEPKTVTNYQITVWFQRKVKNFIEEGLLSLLNKFEEKAPTFKTPIVNPSTEPCMVEIAIFDQHLAKLCWRRETTTDWNLKISRDSYVYSFVDLLTKANHLRGNSIEKIVVPLGQDFFHIDDASNKTPKGKNELDVDDRLDKIFSTGVEALIHCIVEANKIAPVEVIYSPGNHDQSSTYFLCKVLEAYFKNSESITVDTAPEIRKAIAFGNTFIGFAHWQKKNVDPLATIFSTHPVYGKLWGNSKYKEVHTGHFHKKDETSFLPVITDRAVMIRKIPSLTGTDFWHYEHAFVSNTRMAECYIYDKESGPAGYFTSVYKEDIEK